MKWRRGSLHLLATGANALSLFSIQGLSLVVLDSSAYASFALAYLAYSLGVSTAHSIVCDSWARKTSGRFEYDISPLSNSSPTVVLIGSLSGLAGGGIAYWSGASPHVSVFITIAISLSCIRTVMRYFLAVFSLWRYLIFPDLFTSVTAICLYFGIKILIPETDNLTALTLAWALGAAAALAGLPWRSISLNVWNPWRWWKTYRTEIPTLLTDSFLLDFSTLIIPASLSPVVGERAFAAYRGTVNLAFPVRLLMGPVRGLITTQPLRKAISGKRFLAVIVAGVGTGFIVYVGLNIFGSFSSLYQAGSAITILISLKTPVSVYVGLNLISTYLFYLSRGHLRRREIISFRFLQIFVAAALPLGGYYLANINGIVWGLVLQSIVASVVTYVLLDRRKG